MGKKGTLFIIVYMNQLGICVLSIFCNSFFQDLQEEGQVVQVGGLAVRWVLPQHAEPWFLTLQSRRAHCHPTSEDPPTQSSTRKRSRRDAPQETGRPAKRPAVDTGDAKQEKKPPGHATEERKEEEEPRNEEAKYEANEVKSMNTEEEGGQQMQPVDLGGEKKMEAEEQEKMESVVRAEEEEASAAALPGVHEE